MNKIIFKNYTFNGKHAVYVNNLVGARTNSFFKSNISVFIVGALLGIAMNRKSLRDDKPGDKTKIEGQALDLSYPDLWYILQLAVINDPDNKSSIEERLKKLYESTEVPEEYKLLLESYAFAGIEYLHDHLWSAGMSNSEKISQMVAFVMNLNDECDQITAHNIVLKADEVASSS